MHRKAPNILKTLNRWKILIGSIHSPNLRPRRHPQRPKRDHFTEKKPYLGENIRKALGNPKDAQSTTRAPVWMAILILCIFTRAHTLLLVYRQLIAMLYIALARQAWIYRNISLTFGKLRSWYKDLDVKLNFSGRDGFLSLKP